MATPIYYRSEGTSMKKLPSAHSPELPLPLFNYQPVSAAAIISNSPGTLLSNTPISFGETIHDKTVQ
jgi:hypothetical protein